MHGNARNSIRQHCHALSNMFCQRPQGLFSGGVELEADPPRKLRQGGWVGKACVCVDGVVVYNSQTLVWYTNVYARHTRECRAGICVL